MPNIRERQLRELVSTLAQGWSKTRRHASKRPAYLERLSQGNRVFPHQIQSWL